MYLSLEFLVLEFLIYLNFVCDLHLVLLHDLLLEILLYVGVPQLRGLIEDVAGELLIDVPDKVASQALQAVPEVIGQLPIVLKKILHERVPYRVEVLEVQWLVVRRRLALVEPDQVGQSACRLLVPVAGLGLKEEHSLVSLNAIKGLWRALLVLQIETVLIVVQIGEVLTSLVEERDTRQDPLVIKDLNQLVR